MSDRNVPRDTGRGVGSADSERESLSLVHQLISAGRIEAPDPELEYRVLGALAYKSRLVAAPRLPLQLGARNSVKLASAPLAGLALTAGALLWWHSHSKRVVPSAAPERATAAGQAFHAAPATSSQVTPNPCLRRVTAAGTQPLIDDFEDGDDAVRPDEARAGLWRWARDTDAPGSAPALLPIPRVDARPSNHWALHVKGGHLLEWGAVVEFNFNPSCYDASAYQGLSFQAKGPGRVFVAPREVGTIPASEGGTCTKDCYNPHVKKVELDRQWKTVRIEWREFEQRGYGRPPFDPKQLHSIAFLIRTEDTPYDLWLDDVSFLQGHRR